MTDVRLGIIVGSTRPGRHARAVAEWVLEQTAARTGVRYEIVDLAAYPLPHLDEPMPPSFGQYQHDHTKAWATTIDGFDGFIFVTPEYNHSTSGVLKNAIDYLYAEWNNKAIEHLRGVCAELQIATVRQQLSFSLFTDFENFAAFTPAPLHDAAATTLFDQLESWAGALKPLRG